mmetsp:Transcript_122481/g.240379  ORF Transcript_122481/g.240379 Transcript_122481/m.240379 type:complete len:140 (+) Transcript_122481:72-491(+)
MVDLDSLTASQYKEFKEAFDIFDADGNGLITTKELATVMTDLHHDASDGAIKEVVGDADNDGSGAIDFPEFVLSMKIEAFRVFDINGDGYITKDELRTTMLGLNLALTSEQLDEMMKEADVNQDGKVDYEEFVKTMLGK